MALGRACLFPTFSSDVALSRDSWLGRRIEGALAVEIDDRVMDGLVEGVDVREGLVGEVMALRSRQTGSISLSSGRISAAARR